MQRKAKYKITVLSFKVSDNIVKNLSNLELRDHTHPYVYLVLQDMNFKFR